MNNGNSGNKKSSFILNDIIKRKVLDTYSIVVENNSGNPKDNVKNNVQSNTRPDK